VQCSAVQCSAVQARGWAPIDRCESAQTTAHARRRRQQRRAVQCSAVQCSAVQCSSGGPVWRASLHEGHSVGPTARPTGLLPTRAHPYRWAPYRPSSLHSTLPTLHPYSQPAGTIRSEGPLARGDAWAGQVSHLHCTALHCTALHCTALHCTALHWGGYQQGCCVLGLAGYVITMHWVGNDWKATLCLE
jgi:hypothetical protein